MWVCVLKKIQWDRKEVGELRIEGRDLSWHMDCKLTLNGARTHDEMRGVWCEGI